MEIKTATQCASANVGSKDNKAFMILSALGILFVVDVHLGNAISFLTQIFPYDSFFMPMFVFISGYFFKEKCIRTWQSLLHFTLDKIRKLCLPYLGWVVFYGILTALLRRWEILQIGEITFIDLIHNMITAGTSFCFNDPAWFVPLLFGVIISYTFLRRLFSRCWNDVVAMVLLALLGAAAVWASGTSFRTNNTYMLLKIPFFLQFYHLAVLFRNKLESSFDRLNGIVLCAGAAAVNLLLTGIYGSGIAFPMCASMSGFTSGNPFLPLITSITGIAFWLKIAKGLVPSLGGNPLVNFISDHTAFLMTHHVAVKHLFIGLLLSFNSDYFSGIDVARFRTDAWYVYSDHTWIICLCYLFTVTTLIILCKLFLKGKKHFYKILYQIIRKK